MMLSITFMPRESLHTLSAQHILLHVKELAQGSRGGGVGGVQQGGDGAPQHQVVVGHTPHGD